MSNQVLSPLIGFLTLKYHIEVLTGLHIGGSKDSIEIGGIDNPVIKLKAFKLENNDNPLSDVPYIPGSSLKGKIRSLLELAENKHLEKLRNIVAKEVNKKPESLTEKEIINFLDRKRNTPKAWNDLIGEIGTVCSCGECNICKLFGTGGNNIKEPIRLRFSEFYPTEDTIDMWKKYLGEVYTEMKTENRINRITSVARDPRYTERVIANSVFTGDITFRLFEGDNTDLIQTLKTGMELLEKDYLGGSGSRGYGRVKIYLCAYQWYSPGNKELSKGFENILNNWKVNCENKE